MSDREAFRGLSMQEASIRPAGERARDSQAPGWLELDRCHLDRPAAFARAVCVPLALPRIIMAASVHVSRTERGRLFLFLMRGRAVFFCHPSLISKLCTFSLFLAAGTSFVLLDPMIFSFTHDPIG